MDPFDLCLAKLSMACGAVQHYYEDPLVMLIVASLVVLLSLHLMSYRK